MSVVVIAAMAVPLLYIDRIEERKIQLLGAAYFAGALYLLQL